MFRTRQLPIWAVSVAVWLGFSTPARAGVINTFDSPGDVTLSPTQAPGTWYPDRFPPAQFASGQAGGGRTGVLALGISSADFQTNNFYNFQGRKFDLTPGQTGLFVDVYVPSSTAGYRPELWATGFDNTNAISAYPIIEFNGTANSFRTWDYINGGWTNVPGLTGTDQWYQIGFSLAGNTLTYFVNGTQVGTIADPDTLSFGNVMLQGVNSGSTYTAYFDNLGTTPVPEPATAAVLGVIGLAGVGFRLRRRG